MSVHNGYWLGGIKHLLTEDAIPRMVEGERAIPVANDGGGNAFLLSASGAIWRLSASVANMKLVVNLLVLRCKDIEITRRFYEQLGLTFVEEQHGTGPQHYASESGGFVLELYPAAEGQAPDNVRIGFSTPFLADLSGNLLHSSDVNILKPPYATADRAVMLLQDPDDRKVELSQPLHR